MRRRASGARLAVAGRQAGRETPIVDAHSPLASRSGTRTRNLAARLHRDRTRTKKKRGHATRQRRKSVLPSNTNHAASASNTSMRPGLRPCRQRSGRRQATSPRRNTSKPLETRKERRSTARISTNTNVYIRIRNAGSRIFPLRRHEFFSCCRRTSGSRSTPGSRSHRAIASRGAGALSTDVFLRCTTTNPSRGLDTRADLGKSSGHDVVEYRFSARFHVVRTHISNSFPW